MAFFPSRISTMYEIGTRSIHYSGYKNVKKSPSGSEMNITQSVTSLTVVGSNLTCRELVKNIRTWKEDSRLAEQRTSD